MPRQEKGLGVGHEVGSELLSIVTFPARLACSDSWAPRSEAFRLSLPRPAQPVSEGRSSHRAFRGKHDSSEYGWGWIHEDDGCSLDISAFFFSCVAFEQFHRDFRHTALLGLVQDRFPKSRLAYLAVKVMLENSAPTERKVDEEVTIPIRCGVLVVDQLCSTLAD